VQSSCNVAAKYLHLIGHPTATESEPVQVEEDNRVAAVMVPVTALACDVGGSVPNFDRSPGAHVAGAGQGPKVNRECTAAVTTPRPNVHSSSDVAATHPSRGGLPKATRRHPADVEEDDKGATVVVPVTALVCDVVGWVPSRDQSRMHPVNDAA
jgi:hypothetical protein